MPHRPARRGAADRRRARLARARLVPGVPVRAPALLHLGLGRRACGRPPAPRGRPARGRGRPPSRWRRTPPRAGTSSARGRRCGRAGRSGRARRAHPRTHARSSSSTSHRARGPPSRSAGGTSAGARAPARATRAPRTSCPRRRPPGRSRPRAAGARGSGSSLMRRSVPRPRAWSRSRVVSRRPGAATPGGRGRVQEGRPRRVGQPRRHRPSAPWSARSPSAPRPAADAVAASEDEPPVPRAQARSPAAPRCASPDALRQEELQLRDHAGPKRERWITMPGLTTALARCTDSGWVSRPSASSR